MEAFAEHRLVLPVCYGQWGEDGTAQSLLESYGLRVVGCGVAASAVCFDKHLTRSVLAAAGLPVTPGLMIRRGDYDKDPAAVIESIRARVGEAPWFVKPARGGRVWA